MKEYAVDEVEPTEKAYAEPGIGLLLRYQIKQTPPLRPPGWVSKVTYIFCLTLNVVANVIGCADSWLIALAICTLETYCAPGGEVGVGGAGVGVGDGVATGVRVEDII